MRQATLKFKNYAGSIEIVNNSDLKQKALQFILISFAILAAFYVIILGNITFNIIERKSYEAEARNISNEVVDLEFTYLKMSEGVDPTLARSMGFKEAEASYTAKKAVGSAKSPINGF